jgi:hypothetical protein
MTGLRAIDGKELAKTLRQEMIDWYFPAPQVNIQDGGDRWIFTLSMGNPSEVDESHLRSMVIWTFSEDRKTAKITIPKDADPIKAVAHFMIGNLFGQGMSQG